MVAAAVLALACGGDVGTAGSEPGTADATSGSTAAIGPGSTRGDDGGAATSTGPAGDGDTSGGVDDTTTGEPSPPPALCDAIAVSLVIDPDAPVLSPAAVDVFGAFFDDVVRDTGAELRLRFSIGTVEPIVHFCLTPGSPVVDGDDLVWGTGGVPHEDARDALGCLLATADRYVGSEGDGDAMFSGLLHPILGDGFDPAQADVAAAMLIAQRDDDESTAVGRPGMASEAYLRLAGQGDRRRVATFSWGRHADELHAFSLSFHDSSAHYDRGQWSLSAAMQDWQPALVQACATHDEAPPLSPPGGCEHIDVLFVVDGSFSMAQEQAALRGADGQPPVFADFTDALLDSLGSLQDFHVGVISSQPGDVVLHRHREQPEMPPSPELDCGLPLDESWITGPSPDLQAQFSCLAATLADTVETTAENVPDALHHPANAGFLRDDALLFVVMITDEDTQGYAVPMVQVHQRILDAVAGDRRRVVVLSIAGDQGTFEAPKTTCDGTYGTASPGRRLTSIVRTFRDKGLAQDICEGDLAAVFDDVLDDVVTACDAFDPEG